MGEDNGGFTPGGAVYLKWTSRSGTPPVPTTLAGSPVVSIYKDNSNTESTAGLTLTVDFDSRVGLNHLTVDTSADGTFYAAGSHFWAVITTGTVGGSTVVGEVVGEFSLENQPTVSASGIVDCNVQQWKSGTVPAVNVTGVPLVDLKYILGTLSPAAAGYVAPDWGQLANKTAAVDLTNTTIKDLDGGNSVLNAVSNIAVTSAALNATAASATYTTGTSTGGVANTYTLDGVFDSVAAAGNAIDVYYEFDLSATTGATAVGATWDGYLAGAVNTLKVYAYNWGGSAWDQVGNVIGIAGTVVGAQEFELTNAHTGTGGNLGKARIRFAGTGLTTGTLKTDRILLGYAVVVVPPANFSSLVISGTGVADARLADGVAHGGTPGSGTATFAMQSMNITNPSGDGVLFSGASPGFSGLVLRGGSGGSGLDTQGGNFGILCQAIDVGSTGLEVTGYTYGASIGSVLDGYINIGSSVAALEIHAGDNHAAAIAAFGPTAGGSTISVTSSAGDTISIQPTAGHGIAITGNGSGKDAIKLTPGSGGYGLDGTLSPTTLASLVATDTGKVTADIVTGSVVYLVLAQTVPGTFVANTAGYKIGHSIAGFGV